MPRRSALEDEPFWQRVQQAPLRFLGLDYDGTLAPFAVDRMAAVPSPGAVAAIKRIRDRQRTDVVIISGRLVREVKQLLGELDLTVVGSHGYEIQPAGGPLTRLLLQPQQQEGLDQARRELEAEGLADRIEQKVASLAFHTRGLPQGEASRLEQRASAIFAPIAGRAALGTRPFNGGVELRALGVDKGTILEGLLAQHAREILGVYIGDDLTDEDAFAVIAEHRGVGVKVGGQVDEETRASAWLPDCAEVVRFLQRWSQL